MRGELSKKRWGDPIRQLEFDVMDNAHGEAVLSYRLEESRRKAAAQRSRRSRRRAVAKAARR